MSQATKKNEERRKSGNIASKRIKVSKGSHQGVTLICSNWGKCSYNGRFDGMDELNRIQLEKDSKEILSSRHRNRLHVVLAGTRWGFIPNIVAIPLSPFGCK
jgi:hypothetical protein